MGSSPVEAEGRLYSLTVMDLHVRRRRAPFPAPIHEKRWTLIQGHYFGKEERCCYIFMWYLGGSGGSFTMCFSES